MRDKACGAVCRTDCLIRRAPSTWPRRFDHVFSEDTPSRILFNRSKHPIMFLEGVEEFDLILFYSTFDSMNFFRAVLKMGHGSDDAGVSWFGGVMCARCLWCGGVRMARKGRPRTQSQWCVRLTRDDRSANISHRFRTCRLSIQLLLMPCESKPIKSYVDQSKRNVPGPTKTGARRWMSLLIGGLSKPQSLFGTSEHSFRCPRHALSSSFFFHGSHARQRG